MRSRLLTEGTADKTRAVIFETGDEAMSGLLSFAAQQSIKTGHFPAIGAFSSAVLGYYEWEAKKYRRFAVDEHVEVVTLMGDIAIENGQPSVHAHAALAKRRGSTVGGHFFAGQVRPTLEVMLSESPKYLERKFDKESGLALIRVW